MLKEERANWNQEHEIFKDLDFSSSQSVFDSLILFDSLFDLDLDLVLDLVLVLK